MTEFSESSVFDEVGPSDAEPQSFDSFESDLLDPVEDVAPDFVWPSDAEPPSPDSFESDSLDPVEDVAPDFEFIYDPADLETHGGEELLDSTEFPDMPVTPIDDLGTTPPETLEPDSDLRPDAVEPPEPVEPALLNLHQGQNDLGYGGTCGPTTISNSLNTLFGGSEYSENSVLHVAVDNNLCSTDVDPASAGGVGPEDMIEIYRQLEPERIEVEHFEGVDALSQEQIADCLEGGSVVNLFVDSATLWNEREPEDGFLGKPSIGWDHAIQVLGAQRNESGEITGWHIADSSGNDEQFVDADKFNRMYVGDDDVEVINPQCFVISKNPLLSQSSRPAAEQKGSRHV